MSQESSAGGEEPRSEKSQPIEVTAGLGQEYDTEIFLQALDPVAEAFTFSTFGDGKNHTDKTLARILHGSFAQCEPELRRLNGLGAGVFVTINRTDFKGRTEGNIVAVRAVAVDLDGASVAPVLAAKPHIVTETSPGRFHAYWRVNDLALEQFTEVQKALAARFNGDPKVCDLPRVLRLPGFYHRKGKPFRARIHLINNYPTYSVKDFGPVPVSEKPRREYAGGDEFNELDTAALQNLGPWVSELLGDKAKPTARGFRVSSQALGRDLQEDLSITSAGIVDFGVADMGDATEGKRTPITLIMDHKNCTKDEAAAWLCEKLGRPVPERSAHVSIDATPWRWLEPSSIPKRPWVYGTYYMRKNISALLAPGGAGKSNLAIGEALAMASGQAILGISPVGSLKVWIWNGEDSRDELDRRIAAAAKHHDLHEADIAGRLFIDSGRTTPIVIAEDTRKGIQISHPVAERMTAVLRQQKIDVFIVDPFISCHRVVENDNGAIDVVVKTWGRIAEETDCAIMLVHHVRKTGAEAITVEDARGGSSFRDAVRIARTINTMTAKEATDAGIEDKHRRRYFRTDLGKANFSAPAEKAEWYHLLSVDLGNGEHPLENSDSVGVVTPWKYPLVVKLVATVADIKLAQLILGNGGPWRADARARAEPWVGVAVAEAMQKDLSKPLDKKAVEKLVKDWLDAGWLKEVERPDREGRNRPYIEVGEDPE